MRHDEPDCQVAQGWICGASCECSCHQYTDDDARDADLLNREDARLGR